MSLNLAFDPATLDIQFTLWPVDAVLDRIQHQFSGGIFLAHGF
jgi:hypothetical protein